MNRDKTHVRHAHSGHIMHETKFQATRTKQNNTLDLI